MEPFLGLGLTTWLIGVVVAMAVYYWHNTFLNHYWKTQNIPSDGPGIMLGNLGNLVLKGKTLFQLDQEQYKKHGKLYGGYLGNNPLMMVAEPELLRLILVKDFRTFPERKVFSQNKLVRQTLVGLSGDDWKRVRAIVASMFTYANMTKVSRLVTKHAKTITETFLKHADSKTNVELKRLFGGFSIDCIASSAYGTELDSIRNPENTFAANARKIIVGDFSWRKLLCFLAPRLMKKIGITFSNEEVVAYYVDFFLRMREQRMNAGGKVHDDFLQMLMDKEQVTAKSTEEQDESYFGSPEQKTLSRMEMVAQCFLFVLVGFDTVALSLVHTCYLLAQNQTCQARLHEEVDEIWEKHQGNVDYDAANRMKYLDAVISEALRMYPSTVRLLRTCVEDYKLGNTGITIPKGMTVVVPVYALHRDPEFFPDPEIFKPERFLAENKDSIKPYTYIPFGSGPRNCVGMKFAAMEMKLCLVNVLRHVSFHTCAETEIPLKYNNRGVGLQPKNVTVRVERRR